MRIASAVMAVATGISVFGVRWWQWESAGPSVLDAVVFTVVLLAILAVHELAHVLAARGHGFRLGPPLFLPLPAWVGTLGAVIQIRELPPSRSALIAMGAAGPLAGFGVIVVALALRGLEVPPSQAGWELSTPLVFQLLAVLTGGSAEVSTRDPVGFAAWVGCLVTALNLVPLGQLDGGHVLSGLLPERIGLSRIVVVTCLLILGVFWWPWIVWALVLALGLREPLGTRDAATAPGRVDWALAVACLAVFTLCFTPVPVAL